MQREVCFSEDGGILTAYIGCDIDHHTAKPMREKIDRRLFENKPHTLIIDFMFNRLVEHLLFYPLSIKNRELRVVCSTILLTL